MTEIKKKILIVEDDPTLMRSLLDVFSMEHFEILTAVDGESALEMIMKNSPDLVLLDIILPKMDGMMLLRKLRADARFVSLPVIMLTNKDDMETIGESIVGGVQDFLVKHEWKLQEIVARAKERLGVK
ncbi:MAG: OmpR family two-component response regulator [Parcubacteria group bacterium Gr01-1014_48]|nr:MAG: OmpR family two-component response regulator [Parcubacteria group bacterium Greene0416_14]TSC72370.1 MAG: OmpR family two-component response regulator [Parcubacteria group bacterium Gr01-1014_48]TSC99776.1 MAG: OmpR family two-component response regulator [Parcubacteria group bacterium Greene1014_15]TSD08097.1 MAG: OmpR family two-component response regulator [Parcubacteria group bacterium Greene0714_4]